MLDWLVGDNVHVSLDHRFSHFYLVHVVSCLHLNWLVSLDCIDMMRSSRDMDNWMNWSNSSVISDDFSYFVVCYIFVASSLVVNNDWRR